MLRQKKKIHNKYMSIARNIYDVEPANAKWAKAIIYNCTYIGEKLLYEKRK
jgi:hypothetical protein